ncbi:MAG TPA: 30S ribosomal protein S3 [Planctomycetota bacterium]|nr:30S ribosomal protein S3 [Planctomycetota bacterium]
MGHKVHPIGFRIGITEDWRSRWNADKKSFGLYVVQDELVRRHVKKVYHFAGVPRIDIERTREQVKVILYTARPGIVIGRKGTEIDRLKGDLERLVGREVQIKIEEVTKPELEAQLVAENIVEQLEKRSPFRRVLKKAADTTMQAGARGIKVQVGGRLGGAEIARSERLVVGEIPLHTLRADISYGFGECRTNYGRIGVKVWVYRGEKPLKEKRIAAHAEAGQAPQEPAGAH